MIKGKGRTEKGSCKDEIVAMGEGCEVERRRRRIKERVKQRVQERGERRGGVHE